MAILASEPSSTYVAAPEGLHRATCCGVIDLGVLDDGFGERPKVEIRWTLEHADERGKPYEVRRRFTNSLHRKAALRQVLEGWRGRAFTETELKGFDLERLIGAPGLVQIVHRIAEDGRTFANVVAVIPVSKAPPPRPAPPAHDDDPF